MRRKDREVTDLHMIKRIIGEGKVCRMAMVDGQQPYVVPMHYGYTFYGDRLTLYVHSACAGRKLDVLRRNDRICIEIEGENALISGGDDPCSYGASFSSVIGTGRAVFVTEPEEKKAALAALMRCQTGREFSFTEEMCDTVTVLALRIDEYTAKLRNAPLT